MKNELGVIPFEIFDEQRCVMGPVMAGRNIMNLANRSTASSYNSRPNFLVGVVKSDNAIRTNYWITAFLPFLFG